MNRWVNVINWKKEHQPLVRKCLSVLLAGLLLIDMLWVGLVFPFAKKVRADGVSQKADYANPYVISSALPTQTAPAQCTDATTLPSSSVTAQGNTAFTLATEEDIYNAARYSQNHPTANIEFIITAERELLLDAAQFVGFGSVANPFTGTLQYQYTNANVTLTLGAGCAALFNVLTTTATVGNITLHANGSCGGLAQTLQVTSDGSAFFLSRMQVYGTVNQPYASGDAGLLFGTVTAVGSTVATLDLSNIAFNSTTFSDTTFDPAVTGVSVTAACGNAGALIGSVNGVSLTLTRGNTPGGNAANQVFSFSSDVTVSATAGDAGLLVGAIGGNGSSLHISAPVKREAAALASADTVAAVRYNGANDRGGNAGLLVGSIAQGGTLEAGAVTLSYGIVGGGNATGGVAGRLTNANLTLGTVNATNLLVRGGVVSGGYIGSLEGIVSLPAVTLSSTQVPTNDSRFGLIASGGFFGRVNLSTTEAATLSLSGMTVQTVFQDITDSNMPADTATAAADATVARDLICMGGLIGVFDSAAVTNTLSVTGTASAMAQTRFDTHSVASYAKGGLIAWQGNNTYLTLSAVSETSGSESYNDANDLYALYFGGITGYLGENAVVNVTGTVTVSGGFALKKLSASSELTSYAGGLVGYAGLRALVRLTGSTVLNAYGKTREGYGRFAGQIVGYQDHALVFAENGWTLARCTQSSGNGMDDIGNYGAVIQNGTVGAITFNESSRTATIAALNGSADAVTIGSLRDFAVLAITLNTQGYFSGLSTITSETYTTLLDSTLTFTANIDLTGSGIRCLTWSDEDVFTGTIIGDSHTVTMASGERFGTTTGTHGNGEIFGNAYVGLFAAVSNVTVSDLTIGGAITFGTFENGKNIRNNPSVRVGGLAGTASGSCTLNDVTVTLSITEKNGCGNYEGQEASYGGLFGNYTVASGETLTIITATAATTLTFPITTANDYSKVYSGGLIGQLNSQNGGTVNFDRVTLSGSVIYTGQTLNHAKHGGLIAVINSEASKPDALKVTLNNVNTATASAQTIVSPATQSVGGMLGYSWDNVDVTLTNATGTNTLNASLTNTGAGVFGGLVYQMSGRFDVSKTTLTGNYTGSAANSSAADGLLVCQGGNLYAVVDRNSVDFSGCTVSHSGTYVDELVANTFCNVSGFTDRGYGGVVTIENGDAVGSTAHPWVNAAAGVSEDNKYTRYYYNVEALDRAHNTETFAHIAAGTITSKEELLLWHLLTYTSHANTARAGYYFNRTSATLPTGYTVSANLDMTGLCLYPTTSGSALSMDFGGKTLTFANEKFPQTLDVNDNNSRHYMLHDGLFLDVHKNVTVTQLILSGNVGMRTDGSGALIAGTVSGSKTNDTVVKVQLTGVQLNNLSVNGYTATSGYAPLLINRMATYVSATLTDVKQNGYTVGMPVATSLIGYVGDLPNEEAQPPGSQPVASHLTIIFSQMKLEGEKAASIFSKATFMNSYNFIADGTSTFTYNFELTDDWASTTSHVKNVTYGVELSQNRQISGSQDTQYFDEELCVNPSVYPTDTPYVFSDATYLPYVLSKSDATKLKVNIRPSNLTDGCGTYEDPYIIRTSDEWNSLSSFLSSGVSQPKWAVNYIPNGTFCNGIKHYMLTSDTANFTDGTHSVSNTNMLVYLSHAYYMISESIDLRAYGMDIGLGTTSRPFSGVIIGEGTGHTVTMPQGTVDDKTALGFINYAAGCVVRNLTIRYSGSYTITSSEDAIFGGVMAQVLGGDNIIDHVSMDFTNASVTTANLSDTNIGAYIGGYVGLDSAGGVVFRNIPNAATAGLTATACPKMVEAPIRLYINPIIGRVLNGYALYEDNTPVEANNAAKDVILVNTVSVSGTEKGDTIPTVSNGLKADGTKNYPVTCTKLSDLSGKTNISTSISGAEGLLAFSSAMNCGALTLADNRFNTALCEAYATNVTTSTYYRVRNALYTKVGNVSDTDSDYKLSQTDDTNISNKTRPYLVQHFFDDYIDSAKTNSNNYAQSICGSLVRVQINIVADCDMTKYHNGFQGIGGRYTNKTKANKLLSDSNCSIDRNTPVASDINGQKPDHSNVVITMDRRELSYYKSGTTSIGSYPIKNVGLFNFISITHSTLTTANKSTNFLKGFTLKGTVSLKLFEVNGTPYTSAPNGEGFTSRISSNYDSKNVYYSVGGLVGSVFRSTNAGASMAKTYFRALNTRAEDLLVESPQNAGAILGLACIKADFYDVTYAGCSVRGKTAVGGYVGLMDCLTKDIKDDYTDKGITVVLSDDRMCSSSSFINDNQSASVAAVGALIGQTINGDAKWEVQINVSGSHRLAFSQIQISSSVVANKTLYLGGLIGYVNRKATVNGISFGDGQNPCYVMNVSSLDNSATSSASGGLIGKTENETTLTDCTIQNTTVIGQSSAAGIVGSVGSTITLDTSSENVANTITGCTIKANAVGGVFANKSKSASGTVTIKKTAVSDCLLASTANTPSVGGLFASHSYTGAITYTTDSTVKNNCLIGKVASSTEFPTIGGFAGQNAGTLYATGVLIQDNRMGGVEDVSAWSATQMPAAAAITSTSGAASLFSSLPSSAYASVTALHIDTAQDVPVIFDPKENAEAHLVYGNYNGTMGDTATRVSLGSDIRTNPSRLFAVDTVRGDGVMNGLPRTILNGNRYTYAPTTMITDAENDKCNLKTIADYVTGIAPTTDTAAIPLLYVKGQADSLVTDYLNLLTNGGHSSFSDSNKMTAFTASSKRYFISATGVVSLSDDDGSLNYENGQFVSSQTFDKLASDGGSFTVLTVTYHNPDSATTTADYSTSFVVFYPQMLTVMSSVSLKDHAEYALSPFLTLSDSVYVSRASTFSAYFEYVYNELRTADSWNYSKEIQIKQDNGSPLSLPSGTKITLIDVNTANATGYRAYYYALPNAASTIPFASFSRVTTNDQGEALQKYLTDGNLQWLENLPAASDTATLATKPDATSAQDWSQYGVERYVVVFQLPDTEMDGDSQIYHIEAGLTAASVEQQRVDRNVELIQTSTKRAVTVWKDPTVTNVLTGNGNLVISRTEPVSIRQNVTLEFPGRYASTLLSVGATQYGRIRYYLQDETNARIPLPSGTRITVGETSYQLSQSTDYYDYILTDANGDPLNLLQASAHTFTKNVELDFSGTDSLSSFTAEGYKLCSDFYLSVDQNDLSAAKLFRDAYQRDQIALTLEDNSGAALIVNVNPDSLMNLGVNTKEPGNLTNNGTISFRAVLDLTACTAEDRAVLCSQPITLTANLKKKGAGNAYGAVSVNAYLDNPAVTITLTDAERTALAESGLWEKELTIQVKTPTVLSDYANYRYELSTILNGTVSLQDHFIYTLARIVPEYVN